MLLNNANKNGGFSLLEMLLAVIVVGILAAVTAPSLIGLFNQNRVKEGFAQVRGAIKESQRQAKRRGRRCKIRLDTAKQEINISTPDGKINYTGCLLGERKLPDGVFFKNNSHSNIVFSPKGNTNSAKTIVVYSPHTQAKRCLVISLGLGIMRSGNYTGNIDNPLTYKHCDTTGS
ncbi:MAG: Tfp pilus assembly protein FimT/FimU [Xenococcaceae cyanobacterium]